MMSLSDYFSPARWFRMLALTILGILAIYIEAAPLGIGPVARPSPDLLLCVVAYWSLRRPGSSPLLLIFALGLSRDLLTDVPVGAGVLSLVLTAEFLKVWRKQIARASFPLEWTAVIAACIGSVALHWILMVVTFAQPPYVAPLAYQCLYTGMVYPVVVVVFRWLLQISWRKTELPA